jgi:excisionase family DNA binding protein
MSDIFLTRKEVATLFNISVPTVRRWERAGTLPVVRIGTCSPRYRRSDIESFIAAHSVRREATAEAR